MGNFGEVLRELRHRAGISQNELSKHIGVSKSSVNMYERGEREPGFETLEAIADFFNVDMDYLMGRGPAEDPMEIAINVEIGLDLFSEAAKPTVRKFCLEFSELTEEIAETRGETRNSYADILENLRTEIFETFNETDFKHFLGMLETINKAIERIVDSVEADSPKGET